MLIAGMQNDPVPLFSEQAAGHQSKTSGRACDKDTRHARMIALGQFFKNASRAVFTCSLCVSYKCHTAYPCTPLAWQPALPVKTRIAVQRPNVGFRRLRRQRNRNYAIVFLARSLLPGERHS